ncbi:hypothetical protein QBC35DRAFT_373855 [Podospora australis]|uniref:Helicase C-terminal domain-containing protein n=1 Tax=Podospora australis TaxID=1536484 RepID=A0AAN7AMN9_9PEZI|nr:hypothetical protein QBC35DRAFT_373855 [Podospora australis]
MLPGFSRATPVTPLNPAGAHENPVAAPEQHSRIPVAVNPDPQGVEGYQVEEAEDEDFGRLDFRIVDANVRSYNDGDNNSDWLALLDFFHLDAEEVRRRTEINRGNGSTRVPFGRIPGMTVGLFDYQLMGVYKLLGFLLTGVSGGFLADEQGLGKTQEMFGVLVLTYNLRKCKEEVEEVWAARQAHRQVHARSAMHNQRGAEARTCPYDTRFGFRCYCYHPMTRQLADALPDGPSVIIAPTQNCMPIIRDARTKLDQRPLKLRGFGDHIDRDFRLTPAEIQSLRGEVRIQLGEQGVTGARIQQYTACANRSDFIIVTSPDSIDALNQAFTNTVPGTIMRRSSFIPGVVMLDEFHQYAIEESRVLCWLNHVKSSLLNSERPQPMPLVYFVSGTPIDQSPADIRPAYIVLERRNVWSDSQHALNHATLANFDFMTNLFDTYIEQQRRGEEVSEDKVKDFYASLDGIFGSMMVRRLGTNTFRDQPLTNVGRLRVAIIDHRLPSAVADNLVGHGQALSDIFDGPQPRPWVPLSQRLRGPQGPSLLLKLRIASTFPGIPVSNQPFRFTDDEVRRYLTEASGRVERTPYFAHIAAWAAHSPKLETISHTITTMLADNSRIPGEATTRKKYIIFCPVEAEALLMACWLHHRRTQERLGIRVAYIHSSMTPADRQRAITSFLTMGNAPPNILVTPISVGGTGLNLQRAKYSTVTGPAWTKRETQQAFYRIHRVGQVQPTRLQLLAARWNPAERVILSKYEGRDAVAITEENNATEAVNEWFEVSNRFCETPVYNPGRVIDQHQDQNTY